MSFSLQEQSYELSELKNKRDFYLKSIRDLEQEKNNEEVEQDAYVQLKDSYIAKAAELIRQIEDLENSIDKPKVEVEDKPKVKGYSFGNKFTVPKWAFKLSIWILIIAFGVGSAIAVSDFAGPQLPGQTISGSPTLNLTNRLAQAKSTIAQGNYIAASQQYQQILAKHPNQVHALTYEGWIITLIGVQDKKPLLIKGGQKLILKAINIDPNYPSAHFFMGLIALNYDHNPKLAVEQLQIYLKDNPPKSLSKSVQALLAKAQAELPKKG